MGRVGICNVPRAQWKVVVFRELLLRREQEVLPC